MISRTFRTWRRVRSRLSRWSVSADREFHDHLFGSSHHDPFSTAYPGNITIRRFADLAAARLDGARVVLDLGCGPGEITCELAKRFPTVLFHGVDHSSAAIERASNNAQGLRLTNVTFQRADVQTFQPVGRADLVMMFDAFHHLVAPAEFVKRLSRDCPRFFLIEPAGDVLGRWRRAIDFDWLPLELDKIRARIEYALREAPADRSAASPAGAPGDKGRAVEHRYPLADYRLFFDGFHVSARGTVAGLDVYPPDPGYDSSWRRNIMDMAFGLLREVDERLVEQGLDLYAKHWAIYADRDGVADGETHGSDRHRHRPAGVWESDLVRGPHDVRYEEADFPGSIASGAEVLGGLTIRNESWRTLRSEADRHPMFISYRWLNRRREPVVQEGLRSSLPRPIEPGEACRTAVRVKAPPSPGVYILELDMVEEGVTWFSAAGVPPLRIRIRVS